jgi:hypothetical protein
MVKQTPLATVSEVLFNLLLAFLGGVIALKIQTIKNKKTNPDSSGLSL